MQGPTTASTARRSLFGAAAPAPQTDPSVAPAAQAYAQANAARAIENYDALHNPFEHFLNTMTSSAAREVKTVTIYNTSDLVQFLLQDTSSNTTILFHIPNTVDQTTQDSITTMLTSLYTDEKYRTQVAQKHDIDPGTLTQKINHSSYTAENPNSPLVKAAQQQ